MSIWDKATVSGKKLSRRAILNLDFTPSEDDNAELFENGADQFKKPYFQNYIQCYAGFLEEHKTLAPLSGVIGWERGIGSTLVLESKFDFKPRCLLSKLLLENGYQHDSLEMIAAEQLERIYRLNNSELSEYQLAIHFHDVGYNHCLFRHYLGSLHNRENAQASRQKKEIASALDLIWKTRPEGEGAMESWGRFVEALRQEGCDPEESTDEEGKLFLECYIEDKQGKQVKNKYTYKAFQNQLSKKRSL